MVQILFLPRIEICQLFTICHFIATKAIFVIVKLVDLFDFFWYSNGVGERFDGFLTWFYDRPIHLVNQKIKCEYQPMNNFVALVP